MKIAQSTPAQIEAQKIQAWLAKAGGSIRNAYVVNSQLLKAADAPQGIIERILWRIPRGRENFDFSSESLLKLLEPNRLAREIKKQMKLDAVSETAHSRAFEESRRRLIASQIGVSEPDRDARIKEVEAWFKKYLPAMRDTKEIAGATKLRLEAGKDIGPVLPPLNTPEDHMAALENSAPGRVYLDFAGRSLLLLKPDERAVLSEKALSISDQPSMDIS